MITSRHCIVLGVQEEIQNEEQQQYKTYVDQLKKRLEKAYKMASDLISHKPDQRMAAYNTQESPWCNLGSRRLCSQETSRS